jgi:ACS family glucarate transporter-like MFS transporter
MTPPVTAWIMVNFGWQTAFYAAAVLGLLVAVAWFLYATDQPRDHPHVNAAEVALIETLPAAKESDDAMSPTWTMIAKTPTVWWLVLSYSCLGYVAYVYMSWFYLYLVNVRGFGVLRGALFASGPFVAMAVFCPVGGWVTDRLATRWGLNRGRAAVGGAGMILAAASIVLGAFTESPYAAIALLSLGAGWLYFPVGAYWSSTVDLSKRHAGALSGLMNTGANLGGVLSPTLTPWLAEHMGWSGSLGVAACVALAGGLMWSQIKPGDGIRVVRQYKNG